MPRLFREAVFLILRYSGIPFLLREFVQRRKVTIAVYHAPGVERAKDHFEILQSHYNVISLTDYLRAHSGGTVHALPPKSLIITIDDGHRSNMALKPVLERLKAPVTIFL